MDWCGFSNGCVGVNSYVKSLLSAVKVPGVDMEYNRYQLAQPPRSVPWPVQAQVLFGGFSNQFGWLFFGFGMIFVWAFGGGSVIDTTRFWVGGLETAPGTIADVRATNASENDIPVFANQYVFRVERLEQERRGTSFTTGREFAVGDKVTVEYIASSPEISRIQNTRSGLMSSWVFCLVCIFPLVGLGFIFSGFSTGVKGISLLRYGKVTEGALVSKEPTNTTINDRTVYKLTFEFTSESGQTYQAIARSHIPEKLQDEAKEQILYSPATPNRAVLVDNLPGDPDIDEFGQIYVNNAGWGLLVLVLPTLVVLIHGSVLFNQLR
jgi:hypothetical protein